MYNIGHTLTGCPPHPVSVYFKSGFDRLRLFHRLLSRGYGSLDRPNFVWVSAIIIAHMFVPLNVFSSFSLLEGVPSPATLARFAAAAGLPALALTDRGNLIGALEFDQACREAGIQPIFGLTLPVAAPRRAGNPAGSLVLLAQNRAGWRSLCRLSSLLNSEPEIIAQGAVPFASLPQESEGLLCLTGGHDSLVFPDTRAYLSRPAAQLLERLHEAFPGRLYVQLTSLENEASSQQKTRLRAAQELGLPVVFAPEIYYLQPQDEFFQRVLSAMRLNKRLAELPASAAAPAGAYFINPADARQSTAGYPQALEQTVEIAARCGFELPTGRLRFPEVFTAAGTTPTEDLRRRAFEGARQLYGTLTPSVLARLEHELQVISESGFDSLFLIMDEIIQFARQADIPTASRGSASSSLVAHCLGITTPDPLRLNLYFERFLNPARAKPPDIDTDVCSIRRDQLIEHIYEHYGRDHVAMVATINRFRRRSALRETAKAYGLTQAQVNKLVKDLPTRGWGPQRFQDELQSDPYESLAQQYDRAPYPELLASARRLIGHPNHLSIHPGGVVIAPQPLTDLVPTQLSSKGVVITQYDLEGVEAFGLVKIDILGIRGLTVLGEVADHLIETDPDRYHSRLQVLDTIPLSDQAAETLLASGQTIGCFQIESPGMRATLQDIQARSVDDLTAALALYRPGPMTGGLKDAFIRRHLGEEQVEHLHPSLAVMLEDTYGVILYQEQVLRIAHDLAGLSLADADLLRRAMSHFDPGEQMVTLKNKFIGGAAHHQGIPVATGERIWEMMAAFAGYGFPKAHAASYAQIAWRSAWFKSHFPAEFMAAVLANWGGYYSQRVYISEARRLDLPVQAPDVHYSSQEFCSARVEGKPVLFMGLNQVRELTRRTQSRIIRSRPFSSLEDFLQRVDPRPLEAENLIKVGALRAFGYETELLARLPGARRSAAHHRQLPLFSVSAASDPVEPWTIHQRAAEQEAILGLSVDHHPLELAAEALTQAGVRSTAEAASRLGQVIRIAGIRQAWRRRRQLDDRLYYEYVFEDMQGQMIVLFEPGLYRRTRRLLLKPGILIIEGEVSNFSEFGEPLLLARRITPLPAGS